MTRAVTEDRYVVNLSKGLAAAFFQGSGSARELKTVFEKYGVTPDRDCYDPDDPKPRVAIGVAEIPEDRWGKMCLDLERVRGVESTQRSCKVGSLR